MKNGLKDLNNYLFEAIERLEDDESFETKEDFDKEIKRSKAIAGIAKNIIDNASLQLEAAKTALEYGKDVDMPNLFLGTGNND